MSEIKFVNGLNFESEADQKKLETLCKKENWRVIWVEKYLTNDGHRDFNLHMVILEKD